MNVISAVEMVSMEWNGVSNDDDDGDDDNGSGFRLVESRFTHSFSL